MIGSAQTLGAIAMSSCVGLGQSIEKINDSRFHRIFAPTATSWPL